LEAKKEASECARSASGRAARVLFISLAAVAATSSMQQTITEFATVLVKALAESKVIV